MSPAGHYQKAEELLIEAEKLLRSMTEPGSFVRDLIGLAKVHATLALYRNSGVVVAGGQGGAGGQGWMGGQGGSGGNGGVART